MGFSLNSFSKNKYDEQVISFDIPQQRADLSLTDFAEQADITLIFPFDNASKVIANKLLGMYSIEEAIDILLMNTGLQMKISSGDRLTIISDKALGRVDSMNKKSKLSSVILSALSSLVSVDAATQSQDEELVVTGIRASIETAEKIKRNAASIVDAISAEDLGKFPDSNVAESLQRITGIAITRSRGGEGQFVTIRGLGEEFNSVNFNGRPLATESGGREFSFDVIASELISEAQIFKTSQGKHGDGSIGGQINIKTARPLDKPGLRVAGSIAAVNDTLSDDTGPKISGIISNTFLDDTFGALLSFSHSSIDLRTDVVEGVNAFSADIDTNGFGVVRDAFGNIRARDNDNPFLLVDEGTANSTLPIIAHQQAFYTSVTNLLVQEERERTGGTLALQFQPNDNVDLTFDVLYSAYDSPAEAFGTSFFPGSPSNIFNVNVDEDNFVNSFSANVNVDLLTRQVVNDTETIQYGLNGLFQVNDVLQLESDISYSKADGTRNNTDPQTNSGAFYVVQVENARADVSFSSRAVPNLSFTGPNPNGLIDTSLPVTDPINQVTQDQLLGSQLSTHFARNDTNEIKDEILFAKFGGEFSFNDDSTLSFGLDYTDREKTTNTFDNLPSACPGVTPDELASGVDPSFGFCSSARTFASIDPNFDFQYLSDVADGFLSDTSAEQPRNYPVVSIAEVNRLYGIAEQASREAGALTGMPENILRPLPTPVNSNKIEEKILGAFIQVDLLGEFAGIPWQGNAGFRVVETDLTSSGAAADITSIVATGQGNQNILRDTPVAISVDKTYLNVLPSFNIAFELSDTMMLRSGFSKTISRPTISNLTTAVTTTSTNAGTEAQTFGNPLLDPPESNNMDISFEWYGENSSASAALFYKDLSNFVANINRQEGVAIPDYVDQDIATDEVGSQGARVVQFANSRPTNGDSAEITGLELAYQMLLNNGFGFLVNATFVDSDATVAGVKSEFENLSDFSYNVSTFYEKGPLTARISLNHREEYLQTTVGLNARSEFVHDFTQVDASVSYDISDNFTLFLEGVNLTGEDFFVYSGVPQLTKTYEDREPRYTLGLRATF